PYAYHWSFGDGDQGTGQTISYVYLTVGNYAASLTVVGGSGQIAITSHTVSIDTDSNSAGTCHGCTTTATPRTLGLMISFATGVALPLTGSLIISRRHRRTSRNPKIVCEMRAHRHEVGCDMCTSGIAKTPSVGRWSINLI